MIRFIDTQFWDDDYVEKLKNIEKLVFSFLLTNGRTRQCGLYEIVSSKIAYKCDVAVKDVERIMVKLEADGKITYDHETKEVLILNWLKYNKSDSPHVKKRVISDLEKIKSIRLLTLWHEKAKEYNYDVETVGEPPNPNVRVLVDHYNDTYKTIMGVAPPFSKADFGVTKTALREHKNDVERLKNIIEFGIEHIKSKKLTVTMKGCLGDWCFKSYWQKWSECQWQYSGLVNPPLDRQWWKQ